MTNDVYLSTVIQNLTNALPHSKELHKLFDVLQQLQNQFSEDSTGQTTFSKLALGAHTATQEYIVVSNFVIIFYVLFIYFEMLLQ